MNSESITQMNRDDIMRETISHVRRVGILMLDAINLLQHRAINHDQSKFRPDEFDYFAEETPKLRGLTYNSPEYKAALEKLGPALKLHYERNSHHPEFHPNGIEDMDLLELTEMLCDWKAASERHANGNLVKSILGNAVRFKYDDKMIRLLANTAKNLGWMTTLEYKECISSPINSEKQLT